MPDQDYWIVNWKVGSLVRWSGAGSVRNLAFLDLIVNKSQKPIKAFLLDGNQSNRDSQNSLMECDARSGLLDCWLKGWQSGSLVWSRFSQKPRISGSNSKKSQKPIKAFFLDGNQSKLIQLSLTCVDPPPPPPPFYQCPYFLVFRMLSPTPKQALILDRRYIKASLV